MEIIKHPEPSEVKALRQLMGLTAEVCGNLLHVNKRTWQRWESGRTPMPYAYWELFAIKCEMIRAGVIKL